MDEKQIGTLVSLANIIEIGKRAILEVGDDLIQIPESNEILGVGQMSDLGKRISEDLGAAISKEVQNRRVLKEAGHAN